MAGSWHGSTRRDRLPDNWPEIRRKVLDRDPVCMVCGADRSREVDHIVRGDDHDYDNLQGICRRCHLIKSGREGGMASALTRPSRRRPPESHPGIRS